jgi:glutamine amidotransferase
VQTVVIVDYGMGNLRSVQKALERVGREAIISSDPNRVAEAGKIILPGVGAFRDAIARLHDSGLMAPVVEHIQSGKPCLGICLGLQLLFTTSYEDGEHRGLNLIEGEVIRFPNRPRLKVPHMGWNQIDVRRRTPLLKDVPDGSCFYFVHSYYVVPRDPSVIATQTDYASPFTSMIWRDNLFATQFHPEKSQSVGLALLKQFAEL